MPTFILTARHDINRPQMHICRGEEITVNIPMLGITPVNLFGNSRCQDALVRQFENNGIYVPMTDAAVYSRGAWDIKMR